MPRPEDFILNSDFATLKNSEIGKTAQVTIPGSTSVAGSASVEWHVDVPITESYAISLGRIASSKNSNRDLIGNATVLERSGTSLGNPAFYQIYGFMWRVSPNTVRCTALIQNNQSSTLIGASGDEVLTFYFDTFVPPFA